MRVAIRPPKLHDALEELVNQFSDPLSFLRELVQNSLDAGSDEVEVSVERESGEDGNCIAVVRVDDWGEGMNREIVEKRLTRLFSSGKDGDNTKIGKFGIGFVSVFAINPEAVCVDTGRDGEYWRVLFDQARDYKLLSVDEPVDGTKVRIYKTMPNGEFDGFVGRVRQTLGYWCKYTAGEVRFEGESIAEPFGIEAPCQVEQDDGFSRIVVGHHNVAPSDARNQGMASSFGFYNMGLTLIEGETGYFADIGFKVSSPHLEHTLTRDNIIRDEGFDRVLRCAQALIEGPLCIRVFETLAEEVRRPVATALRGYLYRAALYHSARPELPNAATCCAVFMSPSGRAFDIATLQRQHKNDQVLAVSQRSPLSDAAERAGFSVIQTSLEPVHRRLLGHLLPETTPVKPLATAFALAVPVADPHAGSQELAMATATLLEQFGAKLTGVGFGHFAYPDSSLSQRIAITQREPDELTPMADIGDLGKGLFSRRRHLTVNADHATVQALQRLACREPEMAAYMLVKAFMLGRHLDEQTDGALAALALAQRGTHGQA